MSVPAPLLTLEAVTKRFGGLTAVREVSLQVRPGNLLGIMYNPHYVETRTSLGLA